MTEKMTQQQTAPANNRTVLQQDDEIDLMALLVGLVRQKKWIIGCTVGLGSLALLASLLMKPVFTATTTILPPQQQSSGLAAALGSLGSLAGAAGTVAGLKNPNDLYVGMLQSQTVADALIKKFELKNRYEGDTLFATRKVLDGAVSVVAGKDGLISVSVDDEDPDFAAKLANAYIEELKKINQELAVTDASQRRLFFEKQLQSIKDNLARAEIGLKKTQERTGLLQPDDQIKAIIDNVAQLKAGIAAKEVQLAAMRSFATSQNPDLVRAQQEIATMRQQLAKLERGATVQGDLAVPTGKVPETGLEYIRALREVKYQETLFELMSKQFELAKVDEARDSGMIQVLDVATPPDQKSKPRRALIVLTGLIAGLFLGVLIALIKEQSRKAALTGESRWSELRRAWYGK